MPRARMQIVTLSGSLIVILFPVISVTDDLGAAQNPAELACCASRHHAALCTHSIFPADATLPPLVFAELSFGLLRFNRTGQSSRPAGEDSRPGFHSEPAAACRLIGCHRV